MTWEVEKNIIIPAGHNQMTLTFKGEGNHGLDHHRSDLIV